jgi:anti-sigma regulatory factor (Ser/Thr protein kinase)
VESAGRAGAAGFPVPCGVRFGADDLRPVRRVTAAWAARAGLPAARAEDFVIAVHEVAANAVRHGSPAARLLLRVADGAATAEIRDSGRWRPAAGTASAGGQGLALARLVCDEVEIRAGDSGTTVILRMNLPPLRLAPGGPGGPGGRLRGAGRMDGRRIGA